MQTVIIPYLKWQEQQPRWTFPSWTLTASMAKPDTGYREPMNSRSQQTLKGNLGEDEKVYINCYFLQIIHEIIAGRP